jgi:hypothetical protein
MMKKMLLIALLAAFTSVTTAPFVSKVMGFGPGTAYAQDDQGDDNDFQGDDNDFQ